LLIIGFISGILSGLFGVGAFLVAYISHTTENQSRFHGNLCFVFLVEGTYRLVLYTATGIINKPVFVQALKLMPFMLVGFWVGLFLHKRVNEHITKRIIVVLLILSGISLLVTNIF